jgi:hypothetical protein
LREQPMKPVAYRRRRTVCEAARPWRLLAAVEQGAIAPGSFHLVESFYSRANVADDTRSCSNRLSHRTFPRSAQRSRLMADDLRNRGAQDRRRVNIHEDHEVRYWTEKWGITKQQLADAVKKAGVSADAVAREGVDGQTTRGRYYSVV